MTLKYIELKDGHGGPAWIGHVRASKSGKTLYFNGRALGHSGSHGIAGNHFDCETSEEFWVSGPKKNGQDRLFGSAPVMIARDAVDEYLALVGRSKLGKGFTVVDIPETDPRSFTERMNTPGFGE